MSDLFINDSKMVYGPGQDLQHLFYVKLPPSVYMCNQLCTYILQSVTIRDIFLNFFLISLSLFVPSEKTSSKSCLCTYFSSLFVTLMYFLFGRSSVLSFTYNLFIVARVPLNPSSLSVTGLGGRSPKIGTIHDAPNKILPSSNLLKLRPFFFRDTDGTDLIPALTVSVFVLH